MRVNGTLYYVLKDHLGSASVVTDNSGNVVGDQRYYPFGETRLSAGTMYTDQLFTGQRQVAGLGIYHYQSRFYSPKLGRFLSADSIVPNPFNPRDFNRFSYVRNNPVRYVDPSGHICVQNDGGLNEFAMPGNCNGKPPTNLETVLQGSPSGWTKPSKPKSGPLITIVPPGPSSGGIVTVPIRISSGGPGVLTDIGTGVGEFGQVVAATSELQTVMLGIKSYFTVRGPIEERQD